ncbi:hypothetical protein XPA_006952 [Xanthoria parietina]
MVLGTSPDLGWTATDLVKLIPSDIRSASVPFILHLFPELPILASTVLFQQSLLCPHRHQNTSWQSSIYQHIFPQATQLPASSSNFWADTCSVTIAIDDFQLRGREIRHIETTDAPSW